MQELTITKKTSVDDIKSNQVIITDGNKESLFKKDSKSVGRTGLQLFLEVSSFYNILTFINYVKQLRYFYGPKSFENGEKLLVFVDNFNELLTKADDEIKKLGGDGVNKINVYSQIEKILTDTNISIII